jgi:signal transduction histidine kinase
LHILVVEDEPKVTEALKEDLEGEHYEVAVAELGGYTLARRALKPIERMADHAQLITAERLEDRLPIDNPKDELGRLASVFNDTWTRLKSSFEQMCRFTAHVSHELRAPLTLIRSVGEVGLRGRRQESAYRGIIGSMFEEVDRLSGLVDRLLNLSRAETGPPQSSPLMPLTCLPLTGKWQPTWRCWPRRSSS